MTEILTIPGMQRFLAEGRTGLLVDVRSASEFATGHIPGAMHMPLEQIESRVNDLDAKLHHSDLQEWAAGTPGGRTARAVSSGGESA